MYISYSVGVWIGCWGFIWYERNGCWFGIIWLFVNYVKFDIFCMRWIVNFVYIFFFFDKSSKKILFVDYFKIWFFVLINSFIGKCF